MYIISTGHTPYSPVPVAINIQICLPIIKGDLLLFFRHKITQNGERKIYVACARVNH